MEQETAAFEARTLELEKEVAALRVISAKQDRPWYKLPPVIVSILSVIFAVTTASLSYMQNQNFEKREQRKELRQLIQRHDQIKISLLGLKENTKGLSPEMVSTLRNTFDNEQEVVLRQVVQIASDSEHYLSSAELYSVSIALDENNSADESLRFALLAEEKGVSLLDKVLATRQIGRTLFLTKKPEDGRKFFQKSQNLVAEAKNTNESYRDCLRLYTLGDWIEMENSIWSCENAQAKMEEADQIRNNTHHQEYIENLTGWLDDKRGRTTNCFNRRS